MFLPLWLLEIISIYSQSSEVNCDNVQNSNDPIWLYQKKADIKTQTQRNHSNQRQVKGAIFIFYTFHNQIIRQTSQGSKNQILFSIYGTIV